MKKSAFTFGLLVSSLVMLSAMQFFNQQQNSFSNVMAQEYDAGYDDISSYSTYPTDDKKYECRTGPFEGFFVSSVEFCKHVKFDKDKDRKDISRDNRTGRAGPQGPAGPQGVQGIQGPIGPNGTQGPPGIVNAELCPPDTDLENVYVLNGTTAESCDLEPPVANDSNLNVTKLVTCQQADGSGLVPSIQQISSSCDDLLAVITEDQFNITVTDTNVSPSNFNGSEIGTLVTLDAGPFTVREEPYDSVAEEVAGLEDVQTQITGSSPSYSGDCTQTGIGSFSATGEIAAGGQETCNIVNNFTITRTQPFTATVIVEKVMSGGTGSPEDSTLCVSTTDPSTGIITPATPNCAPGSGSGFTYTVIPGTINIEETVVPAGYIFVRLGCSPDSIATAGETETCRVVNIFTGQ